MGRVQPGEESAVGRVGGLGDLDLAVLEFTRVARVQSGRSRRDEDLVRFIVRVFGCCAVLVARRASGRAACGAGSCSTSFGAFRRPFAEVGLEEGSEIRRGTFEEGRAAPELEAVVAEVGEGESNVVRGLERAGVWARQISERRDKQGERPDSLAKFRAKIADTSSFTSVEPKVHISLIP